MFLIWPVALQEAGDYFLRILVNETSLNTSLPSMVMAHPIKYIQIRRISDCSTILKSIILQMFGSIYNHFHSQQEQHFQLLCDPEPAPTFSATVLYIHTICILQKERFLAPIKQILLHCTNKWPRFPILAALFCKFWSSILPKYSVKRMMGFTPNFHLIIFGSSSLKLLNCVIMYFMIRQFVFADHALVAALLGYHRWCWKRDTWHLSNFGTMRKACIEMQLNDARKAIYQSVDPRTLVCRKHGSEGRS